ncbi:hypothetical protein PF008_g11580 [Phytophthora fragariae]|uniref:Uncharacterized protein n=1 Tax=Phytophthora fragariae TaxID=53985 RepID=A0A6G0RQW8_9STRA|nr:hypothetical protein PF008_g11580 [Phytophthora fragariae]
MRASARRLSTRISPLLLAENTALVTSLSPTETIALVTLLPPTKDSAFVTPNKAVKFVTVPPLTKATKLVAPRWSQRLECFDRHVQHCWHLDQATCSCRRGGLTPSRTCVSSLIRWSPSSPRCRTLDRVAAGIVVGQTATATHS